MALKTILAAGIVALGALGAAAPANAGSNVSVEFRFGQPTYASYSHHTLSPQQVRRILRNEGFRQIRYVDRRGTVYRAQAENRRGRDVLVTVSARTGQILNVERRGRRG